MKSNFKKQLLLGAAVTTLSFGVAAGAQAQLAGNSEWGTDAPVDAPVAGDNVNLNSFDLTINSTSNVAVGAITDTGTPADGNVIVTTSGGADKTQAIGSVVIGGNLAVTGVDGDNASIDTTVAGVATIGGNLAVTTDEGGAAHTVTLTLGGNATVDGTTTLTAGDFAGADVRLNVDGATNVFDGAVTVTAGSTGNAILALSGASNTFAGNVALDASAGGEAILALVGTTAQTVTGNITGDGEVVVQNAVGATFNGTVAAEQISVSGVDETGTILDENSRAVFRNTVTAGAGGIVLGGDPANTGISTVVFDSAVNNFVVTGVISGVNAGNTNNVDFIGGGEITLANAITTNIDNVNVTGTDTVLDANAAITAGTVTIGQGATLDAGAIITAATGGIANSGTLLLTGAVTHVANLSGTGTTVVTNNLVGINGTIAQRTVDIGTGTLTQTGVGYNVGRTNFSDDGTLALDDGDQTIAGNFTSTNGNEGTISVANGVGTTTFTGNVGTSASSLKEIELTGAAIQTVAFTGNVFADAITLLADKTASFLGTSAQTVSSAIDGAGTVAVGDGVVASNVTFTGDIGANTPVDAIDVDGLSTATFDGAVSAGDLTVGNATDIATVVFNKGLQISGVTNLSGDIEIGNFDALTANTFTGLVTAGAVLPSTITVAGHTDLDGGLTIGAEGLTLLIKQSATFDPTDADGNGTANQATDVLLDATGTAVTRTGTLTVGIAENTQEIDGGSEIHVITSNASAYDTGLTDGSIVLRNSAFVSLVDNGSDASNLRVVVTNNDAADVLGENSIGVGAANALLNIANADTTNELQVIKGRLQGAQTAEAARAIAESLAPSVDAGAVVGATTFVNQTAKLADARLASLRDGSETGMVAGNVSNGLSVWAQGFGTTGDQDARDGVAGYDVDTLGFAIGADTSSLADNWVVGLGFAYANTDVDSDNVNRTETDIDSYQLSLYSNYNIDDRTYLAGQLSYVWGDNEQTRHDVGGLAGLNADADYDSYVIGARLEAGRSYAAGEITTLTPKVLVNYQHYNADGYTETGAGNASLDVDSESIDLFEVGVGVDASWDFQQADGSYIQPKVGVGVRHDFVGDEYATTSRFTGGGSSFKTEGFDPAQTTFNVGAGVTYYSSTNWELSAAYDYEVKSDYDAHSGTLRAAYKF